jgi:FixJ family two-component response regulator
MVSPSEREQLLAMTCSRTLPHALVRRAQIVLMSAKGSNNITIAEALKVSRLTVGLWRRRFMAQRLPGLYDELR